MSEALGTLLVVDDDAMNREILTRRLRRRGYSVHVAVDGMQALKKIEQTPYDVVLLDIVMPGMNGRQVLKKLRTTYTRLQLPVIMVTAKHDSDEIVEAFKDGANDYVTKPLDLQVVLARVGTHVILKRTTEQLEKANSRLATANTQLKADLNAAAAVQQAYLPERSPRFDPFHFSWIYEPCEQLAGDNLNVFRLDDNHIAFYVLDVSGHGVQAALMSVAASRMMTPSNHDTGLLNRPVRKGGRRRRASIITSPAEVAEKLNRRFSTTGTVPQFFTVVYGVLDVELRELRMTSAGHPPGIYLPREGGPAELKGRGVPIGIVSSEEEQTGQYEEIQFSLKIGDRLYFYTDGVTETLNDNEEQYGSVRLSQKLDASRSLSLDDSLEELLSDVRRWSGKPTFRDDVSILALEVDGDG